MRSAQSLLTSSAVVLAVTAIGYLVLHGVMLSAVGIASTGRLDAA